MDSLLSMHEGCVPVKGIREIWLVLPFENSHLLSAGSTTKQGASGL